MTNLGYIDFVLPEKTKHKRVMTILQIEKHMETLRTLGISTLLGTFFVIQIDIPNSVNQIELKAILVCLAHRDHFNFNNLILSF